jgi:rubrerythrin
MENFPVQDYYVCRACGYVAVAEPPAECSVCGANQKGFFKALSPKESGLVGGLL